METVTRPRFAIPKALEIKAFQTLNVRRCVCVQTISYSLLCKYLRRAVLPADKALCADIYRQRTRLCDRCGKPFAPGSNRQKYCPECGSTIRRKQKADSARRRRSVEH